MADSGLKPFEDFIVDIAPAKPGFDLSRDFSSFVAQQEESQIDLVVVNCYSGEVRHVYVIPTRKWPHADSLLGLKLRPENIENALHSVCRVTQVFQGSPASGSGVLADRDYLVGCLQFEFASVEDFSQKMKVLFDIEVDPCLDLYFFDISSLTGRFVAIKPSNLWKGNGLLGLEFGAGVFDSRLLKEMLEKRAQKSAPPLITIQTNHQHFKPKATAVLVGTESTTGKPESQQGINVKDASSSEQGQKGPFVRAASDCYLEAVDQDGRVHKLTTASLLPSLQFPLRTFVYKA